MNPVEVNESLEDDLGILTDDAYNEGWMLKVKMFDESQLDSLTDEENYQKHCTGN